MRQLKVDELLTGDMILTMRDRLCIVLSVKKTGLIDEEETYVWVLMSAPGKPLSTLCLGRDGTVKVMSR